MNEELDREIINDLYEIVHALEISDHKLVASLIADVLAQIDGTVLDCKDSILKKAIALSTGRDIHECFDDESLILSAYKK